MIDDVMRQLAEYMATRDAQELERVNKALEKLSVYEQALVRDAAVMGYVQGLMDGWVRMDCRRDHDIIFMTVRGCLREPDKYPAVSGQRPRPCEPCADQGVIPVGGDQNVDCRACQG